MTSDLEGLASLLEAAARALRSAAVALSKIPKADGTPIRGMDISVRARKVLNRLNVMTVELLSQKSEEDLLEVKGCGMTTVVELRRYLSLRGMTLRGDLS